MRLRTKVDWFSAVLLSTLGATQACGGNALLNGSEHRGSAGDGASNAGTGNAGGGQDGAATAGAPNAGAPTASAGANSGDGPNNFPCRSPSGGFWDSFVKCMGFKHRKEVQACASRVPRAGPVPVSESSVPCRFDAECVDKPYGWCWGGVGPSCQYGCVTDSDCASDEICECGEFIGTCRPADCVSDADCKPGFLCRSYDAGAGCGPIRYACQTPTDVCGSEADCNTGDSTPGQCIFDSNAQRFQCLPGVCSPGAKP